MKGKWITVVLSLALAAGLFGALPTPRALAATCMSTGTGNWSVAATWMGCTGSGIPQNGDDVVIASGHTVTIDANTATLNSLAVSGTLNFENSLTQRTMNVSGDVTVNNGGTISGATGSYSTVNHLNIGGNLVNYGTFDARQQTNRSYFQVKFNKNGNQSISGSGTTQFSTLTLDMGTSNANVLDVQGVITLNASTNPLIITNGTFKLSSASTIAPFTNGSGATIPATGGFWLNGGTITAGNYTWTLNGLMRISNGALTIGTSSGNSLEYGNNAVFTMEGGTLNIAGRFEPTGATQTILFTMSGGVMTVATSGNGASGDGSFDILTSGSSFTMSGGSIVLQRPSTTSGTKIDYRNLAGTTSITGGTIQFGNASTPTASTFQVGVSGGGTSVLPNLVVNSTNSPSVNLNTAIAVRGDVTINSGATLTANAQTISLRGNWTNNGTFNPGASALTFNGTSPQTIGGFSVNSFFDVFLESASNVTGPGGTMNVARNWTNNGGTFTPGSGTVVFNGSTAQTIGGTAAAQTFNNLTVSNTSGGVSVGGSTTTLNVDGALNLNTGSFTPPATLYVKGNWTNNGAFNHNNGAVRFNGTSPQTIGGSSISSFFDVFLETSSNATGPSGTMKVAGSWTNNGSFTHNNGAVYFNGTSQQTIGGAQPTSFFDVFLEAFGRTPGADGGEPGRAPELAGPTVVLATQPTVAGTLTNNGTLKQTLTTDASTDFVKIGNGGGGFSYYGVGTTSGTGLGSTTVSVSGNQPPCWAWGNTQATVKRCFEITPASAASPQVTFYYQFSELNGLNPDNLFVWRDNGNGTWTKIVPTNRSACTSGIACSVTVNSLSLSTGANRYVLSSANPTAITLAEFYAQQAGDHVLVTWETASELDNRGFNLYRGTSPAGWDRQLNTALIPSQGQGSPSGFTYTWEDRSDLVPGTTYYYWLQDLDVYGATTMHGPVSVDFVAPTAVTLGGVDASPAAGAGVLPWLAVAAAAGVALALGRRR